MESSVDVKYTFSHTICGVCSKPYNDARFLPCLHSFCQQCLHHEIEKIGSQQVFKCPTCERSTNIPIGGASVLPKNLHLGFEVEVAGYISKIISNSEVGCDECIDGHNGPAEVFCCTCRQFLCKLCHHHHESSRSLSKHNMVGLNQEGAKQVQATMKPRKYYCSQPNHEDNKLNSYCETCKCLILTSTSYVPIGHKNHTITELSTVANDHRSAIEDVLIHASGIVGKLTGAIDGNDKIIEQVEISKRNARMTINKAFKKLQQTLKERKRSLLSSLEAISLSKTTALTSQKQQFESIVEDIGHYTEVASHILQTHTDYEVVAMGGLIPTELKAIFKQVEAIPLTPRKHSNIYVTVQTDDLVEEMAEFGYVQESPPLQLSSRSSGTWTSTSVPRAESRYYVKVESKTSKGKACPQGGVHVEAEMKSLANNGAVVYGEVEDHRDGTYTITLTPQTAGPHQLVITMDGQHVQNSPHDLDVRPRPDYTTLSNTQQVIKCSFHPLSVAIHDNGDIYVGASDNCIKVFNQTGQLKNTIGSKGSGDGQFRYPRGISIKGNVLYVADYNNHRVQKLTSGGEFLRKFGQLGSGQGQFNCPSAVIVDSNNRLIVSDTDNHRIQIFNEDGGKVLTIDGKGFGNGSFRSPRSLALDPQGNIYVAALGSNNIKVFTKEGVYVRVYGDTNGPNGVAIDEKGYSLVSENGGNCLSIYDPQGNKIHTVGDLNNPCGTALDPRDGSVYVAISGASTVLKYSV